LKFKVYCIGVLIIDIVNEQLNHFLVNVFNEILRIEEGCLRSGEFRNLSVSEMHLIEAVCEAEASQKNRSSDIARSLGISPGTLTTDVTFLEKKGCIVRIKDSEDKRIVRIFATDKGRQAYKAHEEFHARMVADISETLSPEETDILIKGLKSLETFFIKNKQKRI
jgi:DNA-binding MarR family transcriptional regulator